ncbi:membrane protein [Oceanicola sp. 22II-s10i]|uniref:efflux RND transporter periplasmic adaptor subunit n=1 Tax=Oceanicola sp. 22II-s10i TaxID=1317116 RepID=UPI000B528098|nr:efflux RND transporter periplasmic adaptor subunit [Oceanicola sp. 22II-s10i]OWU82943.1 membrane protein [Oceanicola sp. 22II-s10i]
MKAILVSVALTLTAQTALAGSLQIAPQTVTEWKSVYGTVETRDRIPARARIGGVAVMLDVSEGDRVEAGQTIARIEDDKLAFQIDALDARLEALRSRLTTAQADLERGQQLMERGVISGQRLEALQTAVDVITGEITGTEAERQVVQRQIAEGAVLAPESGIVLDVPVSRGSVMNPGEAVAVIGGGGVFLRLAVPERHATALAEGDRIEIEGNDGTATGTLAKIYPAIEGGRVAADVEVEGLDPRFVGLRMPVRLPVGERAAILVPAGALHRHGGLDFVTVETAGGPLSRAVVPGEAVTVDGQDMREILTGLAAGDTVVTDHD